VKVKSGRGATRSAAVASASNKNVPWIENRDAARAWSGSGRQECAYLDREATGGGVIAALRKRRRAEERTESEPWRTKSESMKQLALA
jgi:hypothetical protein